MGKLMSQSACASGNKPMQANQKQPNQKNMKRVNKNEMPEAGG